MRASVFAPFSLLLLSALACSPAPPEPATGAPATACVAKSEVGVLIMHGKLGRPDSYVAPLVKALRDEGYLVKADEMPWSQKRRFDKTVDESMAEIDAAVESLRQQGARRVVVGGHSLGGAATLRYGATRTGIAGLLLVAPGFNPETSYFQGIVASAVQKARAALDAGRGDQSDTYTDIDNDGGAVALVTRARTYLDWYGASSTISMSRNAPAVAPGPAVLWILASGDAAYLRNNSRDWYGRIPPNPQSRYVLLEATHIAAPAAAVDHVKAWLDRLCR